MFYRIEDPWSLPLDMFTAKALRLFFYQGVLQVRAAEEEDRGDQAGTIMYDTQDAPQISDSGVDMRHNMAAAKAAARGLKNDDGEIQYVPAEVFLAMPEVSAVHRVIS